MSKKILAILVVGILVLCVVSASNHSVETSISPFSFQNIKLDTPASYNSKYGCGVKAGYRYDNTPYTYVGADFSFVNFKYDGQKNHYLVWTLMAKCGVFVDVSKAFKIDLAMGAGVDLRVWGDVAKFYPTAGFYMGGLYRINEAIGLTAGADLRFAWQDNKNSAYSSIDTDVICSLGARVKL